MTGSRGLVIFGSTGSIGTQTLDVVRGGCGRYHVIGLTAHSNAELLAEQASEFRPRFVALSDQAGRERLQVLLERKGLQVPVVSDEELPSMLGTVSYDMSVVAAASVGLAGVVYDLLRSGLPMAIASKELLITLGDLLEPFRAQLRPIDSELSAIWQCLAGENPETVERVILTASGGPLRDLAPDELDGVTAAQALQHPSWRMGPKVTIDSATLFNKALELAEAHVLFGVDRTRIRAVQHPQSIVHGLVEFHDGTTRAILYRPDMRVAIAYALSAPDRPQCAQVARLHVDDLGELRFSPIDSKFEAFRLGDEAGRRSPRAMLALLGADEVAVSRFLVARGTFGDIVSVLRSVLEAASDANLPPTVEGHVAAVDDGRRLAEAWYRERYPGCPGDPEGA